MPKKVIWWLFKNSDLIGAISIIILTFLVMVLAGRR